MSNLIMGDSVDFDIEFRCDQQVGDPACFSLDDQSLTAPGHVWIGDDATICVDVTNNGSNQDTIIVSAEALDGLATVWSDSKSVLVAGGATETVCFNWDTTGEVDGTYQVNVSIPAGNCPADSEGPAFVILETMPMRVQPGSYWIYDVSEIATGVGCVDPPVSPEYNTWTCTLAALDVVPSDSSPSGPGTPNPWVSNRYEWEYSEPTMRKPSNCPGVIAYDNSTSYVSVDNGTINYRTLDGWIFVPGYVGSPNLRNEWGNHGHTLTSVSGNIGKPYTLGSMWEFYIFSGAVVSGSPLSPWTWWWQAEVTAVNATVTVPAGTFTDCSEIEMICDWGTTDVSCNNIGNSDGVYDPACEVTVVNYHSETAQANVKMVDYLTMDCESGCNDGSINTWNNPCQGSPANMIETQELASYSLIWA
jgi:hypothetical protein